MRLEFLKRHTRRNNTRRMLRLAPTCGGEGKIMPRVVLSKFLSLITLALLPMAISVYATGQERPQVAQGTGESGEWLLGEWVGIRGEQWEVDATIRITSYNPTTHEFKGDGKFVNNSTGKSADLIIEGVIDDKGTIVMTTHHVRGNRSGSSYTFNLIRNSDVSLNGMTAYGPPSLSLRKKQ